MPDHISSPLLEQEGSVARQFLELVENIDKQHPAPADLRALRDMLAGHPELWRVAGDLACAAARNLLRNLNAGPLITESLKRGWTAMRDELGYQLAPPLERLLIEQVVLCWLHLYLVDMEYTRATRQPVTLTHADHWERRLSAAQRRYLRACETLARIRKLARSTPALQVNIAAHGGQQVNLQGPT